MDMEMDGLMQKRCNSSANALELHLFCFKSYISNSVLQIYITTHYITGREEVTHGDNPWLFSLLYKGPFY